MVNYADIERAIIARLIDKAPLLQQVSGYNELDRNLFTDVRKSPAAFVLFDGVGRPSDQVAGATLLEARWGVVLAVRGGNDKAATRQALFDLVAQTMSAMDRFKPAPTGHGMRLLEGPEPRYYDGGHASCLLVYGHRHLAPVAVG